MSDEETSSCPFTWDQQPMYVICPYCKEEVITIVKKVNGAASYPFSFLYTRILYSNYLFSFAMFFFFFPIFWVGFCLPSLKDVYHYCPSCKKYLGRFQPIRS